MRVLFTLLLACSSAFAADWTIVQPEVLTKEIVIRGESHVIKARVRFTDDTTPVPNTREKDYFLSGSSAFDTLKSRAYADRETLQGFEAIVIGGFDPVAPTAVEAAVANANLARLKMRNMNAYQLESGKADGATIGTSGITFTQAKNSLITAAEADVTNQARLDIFAEETR